MKVEERVRRAIAKRKTVILRSELAGLASPSQLSKVLRALVQQGMLVRIGRGIYARTRRSSVTGAVIPAGSLETLATQALGKLGVPIRPGKAAAAYNDGRTTQLPGAFVVDTGPRRISRKITVGGRTVHYERTMKGQKSQAMSKQPVIVRSWRVFEVQLPNRPGPTRHVVGTNMDTGEGMVSSAIVSFNPSTGRVETESGSVYMLEGVAAVANLKCEALWARWTAKASLGQEREVTTEYAVLF